MAASDKKRKGKAKLNAAQAYKLGNRAAVNKARVAKRVKHEQAKKLQKTLRRQRAGKPARGHARSVRRARASAAHNEAIRSRNFDSPVLSEFLTY